MAKKTVATLKKADAKVFVKVIRMVKNDKTGGYQFQEQVLAQDEADTLGEFAPHWVYPGDARIERHVAPFPLSAQRIGQPDVGPPGRPGEAEGEAGQHPEQAARPGALPAYRR